MSSSAVTNLITFYPSNLQKESTDVLTDIPVNIFFVKFREK